MESTVLTIMTFLPILGAALLYVLPGMGSSHDPDGKRVRLFSLVVTLVTFALSLLAYGRFERGEGSLQLLESFNWLPSLGITYRIGVDGISIFLVLLTTALMPIVVLASASVHDRVRGYLACMLVLQTAMLGTLVALDLFLFYIFWELMLAPMYFIIGIWGGKRRIYATVKFVLYTAVGSVLMLVAIFYVVWSYYDLTAQAGTPTLTFDLATLQAGTRFTLVEQCWLFGAFALAFGIKVPIFPFHTWLPDAHVEAPTGGSVVLAGVLLKMGLYGFIRFAYPLFPNAAELFAPYIATLAVIGIVYGALVAWAQSDIKKLVAYSSVSHLGYCVLGLVAFNSVATTGSIYQMLNHGVSTGALFLLVGVLYDRRHTRAISEYGGLASKVPVFAFLFLVFTLSSIALPLTNGFIGEFLILTGSYKSFPALTIVAVSGVILGAIYMLTVYLKTTFGELDEGKNGELTDVNRRELACLAPLFVLVFWMGLFPQPFLRVIEPSVNDFIGMVSERRGVLASTSVAVQGTPSASPDLAAMHAFDVVPE